MTDVHTELSKTNKEVDAHMKLLSLNWSDNKGEGSVSYSKIFNEAHIVVQLDMLQDCIADLTDKYDALLALPSSEQNT
jgi:hypothetical protein